MKIRMIENHDICRICNKECKPLYGLGVHICRAHGIGKEEYYDKYLRLPNEGICSVCGNTCKFINLNDGYTKTCGNKECIKISTIINNKKTKLERYGDENYNNSEQQRQTSIERYGGVGMASNIISEKVKKTNLDKYGTDNPSSSDIVKKKRMETFVQRYGVKYSFQIPEVMKKSNSIEARTKRRLKFIKKIEDKINNGFQLNPNYNADAIPIIEMVAKEFKINDIQHAENGGEFYIKELGYWVDGYSKEKNIVIEYDERRHHYKDGELNEKDIKRQNEIISHLNCKFVRIKYDGTISVFND